METAPEQIIEIVKGKIEGEDCVYEWTLGFCEGRVYPYVTMDYRVFPVGMSTSKFAGRSPQGLVAVLTDHDYPIPDILTKWNDQTLRVTVSMLSDAEDHTLAGLRKHYTEQLTEADIEGFIRKEVSEVFQEATIALALHTYWAFGQLMLGMKDLTRYYSQRN